MARMDQMIRAVNVDTREAKHDEADAQKHEGEMKDSAVKWEELGSRRLCG